MIKRTEAEIEAGANRSEKLLYELDPATAVSRSRTTGRVPRRVQSRQPNCGPRQRRLRGPRRPPKTRKTRQTPMPTACTRLAPRSSRRRSTGTTAGGPPTHLAPVKPLLAPLTGSAGSGAAGKTFPLQTTNGSRDAYLRGAFVPLARQSSQPCGSPRSIRSTGYGSGFLGRAARRLRQVWDHRQAMTATVVASSAAWSRRPLLLLWSP